jgi:hypothetical protein
MCVALRIKLICKQKRNDVIKMNELKIRRMRRRNASQRAITRRTHLNALQRHTTRAYDAKTRVEQRDAIAQIENALIDVLNAYAK